MTFLYPLGFLALLAIPVLILIYIIKNRYTEQTIASTYLWTLSERFLRRRIPINRLTGIISLILQILAVILIAIILAHPIISIPNGANEFCFILDGSGSMNIEQGGSTRFEEGKKKIAELIDDSMNGSTYTLICVGDTVYKSSTFTSKELALEMLNGLEVSYVSETPASALSLAQQYFSEHPAAATYLVTDRTYKTTTNVNVINVLSGTENYAVADVTYTTLSTKITITGSVISYGSDATLSLDIYFDYAEEEEGEGEEPVESEYIKYSTIENIAVTKGVETEFSYDCPVTAFRSFKVVITQEDSLALDNEVIVYNVKHENMADTLLVYGKTINPETKYPDYIQPNYLIWALKSSGNSKIEIITDTEYASNEKYQTGYGLYVFNNCGPTVLKDKTGNKVPVGEEIQMPREGSVWFVNPRNSIPGANFTFLDNVVTGATAKYSTSKNTTIRNMLSGVVRTEFELDAYAKLSLSGTFIEYLKADGNPLLASGTNVYGNREVIFGFDFGASADFTLMPDCISLISKLLNYSFPEVLEQTSYYCGETLQVNIVSGCIGLRIDSPLGNTYYPDISTTIGEQTLTEVGVYTVHLVMNDNSEREFYVYSSLPKEERALEVEEQAYVISGVPSENRPAGIIDNLLIVFIILAVISVADYGVYCYEQYQLR